jgi:hypothetical protein
LLLFLKSENLDINYPKLICVVVSLFIIYYQDYFTLDGEINLQGNEGDKGGSFYGYFDNFLGNGSLKTNGGNMSPYATLPNRMSGGIVIFNIPYLY